MFVNITDCLKLKTSALLCLRKVFLDFDKLLFVVERHHANIVLFGIIYVADRFHGLGKHNLLWADAHGENLIGKKLDKLRSSIAC